MSMRASYTSPVGTWITLKNVLSYEPPLGASSAAAFRSASNSSRQWYLGLNLNGLSEKSCSTRYARCGRLVVVEVQGQLCCFRTHAGLLPSLARDARTGFELALLSRESFVTRIQYRALSARVTPRVSSVCHPTATAQSRSR